VFLILFSLFVFMMAQPKQAVMISCLCFRTLKARCNLPYPNGEHSSMKNAYDLPIVEAALAYARKGWPVFPLHNKKPFEFVSRGVKSHGYKDATTDEETIRKWWTYHPGATIGLATGSVSGVIV
jgi:hypothetical protein